MTKRALLVMPAADRDEVLQAAADSGFQFESVTTCNGARRAMRAGHTFDVVVTDLTLCDGNWWSVYQDLTITNSPAEIVVIVPRKAVNVEEILAHGVYAVLGQPLERDEVLSALESAVAQKARASTSSDAFSAQA